MSAATLETTGAAMDVPENSLYTDEPELEPVLIHVLMMPAPGALICLVELPAAL